MRRRTWIGLALGCAVTALGAPRSAHADNRIRRDPPLLFGGGPHTIRPPVEIDPLLPTGAPFAARLERPHSIGAACSAKRPVCVQRSGGAPPALALRALSALELAYERVVDVLRLPAPLSDDGHGGSDALDWYLGSDGQELSTERDAVGPGGFDRAAAFCVAGASDDALLPASCGG